MMILGAAFSACSSDGPDKPEDKVRLYNEADSVALCKILKAAYGPYLDGLMYIHDKSLDDMSSWYPMVVWENVEGSAEKRIVSLTLPNLFEDTGSMPASPWPSEEYGHISPAIWDLECMKHFLVVSEMFHGEIPPCGDGGQNLLHFEFRETNISALPLDLFTLPNLRQLYGRRNMALKKLPDGLETIPFRSDLDCWIYESGLTDDAPVDLKIFIRLTENEYTSVDWEKLRKVDVLNILTHPLNPGNILHLMGPHLRFNKITGTIPDDILTDPLLMVYILNILNPQDEGYGFDNLPSVAEIFAMKQKYMEEHPETAQALSKIYPLSETGWLSPEVE